jgi:hypothetical protein
MSDTERTGPHPKGRPATNTPSDQGSCQTLKSPLRVAQTKVYKRHYCTRQHRSHRAVAACIWPRHEWIIGDGAYACLAWCGTLTITLWRTAEAAYEARRACDRTGCGHACYGRHEVIMIDLALGGRRAA